MLKRLHLRNFTVFADAEFEFGEGLNVLVGANGTGKTHVLKAGYVLLYDLLENIQQPKVNTGEELELIPQLREASLKNKLKSVFQTVPFQSNKLVRQEDESVKSDASIVVVYPRSSFGNVVVLAPKRTDLSDNSDYLKTKKNSGHFLPLIPTFIPAKEALTLGWLPPLYGRFDIPFDETYPDLLRLLSGPPLRQPEPAHIVKKLQELIGGKVEEEGGHFYLTAENQPRLEMNLVAEGMRKLATLYKLLANGTLTPETTLFWDEPEANLNPALLKELAAVLTELAQAGFQVVLATHSLFLMRELHILAQQRKKPVRYFGLYAGAEGDVRVERQDDLMQLQHLVALDAELRQTFDFEAALDQDYAGDN